MDKPSLYADDSLLFLRDMDLYLTSTMTLIETFASFSGFVINWDKSVLIPVDEPSADCSPDQNIDVL